MIAPTSALAIDTTSATLRLGLTHSHHKPRTQAWELGRDLSIQFHQRLVEFMAPQTWFDLAWIAVARGPGSYTGTRIGMVTATTLAQQLQLPLYPISTLATYAWAVFQQDTHASATLAVSLPGQRDQVHGGIYQLREQHCQPLIGDRQWSPAEWQQQCLQFPQAQRIAAAQISLTPNDLTQALLSLGHQHQVQGVQSPWQAATPYYA